MRSRCNRCNLCNTATNIKVPSRGSDTPLILFVGEAPGATEDERNTPFCGKAGKRLDRLIETVALDPNWCRWTNVVRCIPRDSVKSKFRVPTEQEIESCLIYTEAEILSKKPVFVVTLGNTALHALLPKVQAIGKARKKRHRLELPSLRNRLRKVIQWAQSKGYDLQRKESPLYLPSDHDDKSLKRYIKTAERFGFPKIETRVFTVYPTYHPSAVERGNELAENAMIEDLAYLKTQISGNKSIPFESYQYLETLESIKQHYDMIKQLYREGKIDRICIDLETNGLKLYLLKNPKVLLFSIAYGKGKAITIPFEHMLSPFYGDKFALQAIVSMTEDLLATVPVTNQNMKFDLHWLLFMGIDYRKIKPVYGDTLLAAWTLWNDTIYDRSLESLAPRFTGMISHKEEAEDAKDEMIGKVVDDDGNPREPTFDDIDIEILHKYCCADVDSTLRLDHKFEELMKQEGVFDAHKRVCTPLIIPTTVMEMKGIKVDLQMLEKARKEIEQNMDAVYDRLNDLGIAQQLLNIINEKKKRKAETKGKKPPKPLLKFQRQKENHTLQLTDAAKRVLCFDVLGLKPIKYGKTGPSIDSETIDSLMEQCTQQMDIADEQLWKKKLDLVSMIRDYSNDNTVFTKYIKPLPNFVDRNGLVHPDFKIRQTATGRYSTKEPALHNTPSKGIIKKAFLPIHEDGLIVNADYSQMELRVMAALSNDQNMLEAFHSGQDIHKTVASMVLQKPIDQILKEERRRIKAVNFGMIYGRAAPAIAAQERISEQAAQDLIDRFFEMFPDVKKWIHRQYNYAQNHNCIWSPMKFRRLFDSSLKRGERNRRASNTPIQGGASDIGCLGIQNVFKLFNRYKLDSHLFGFIHDALLFSIFPNELYEVCILSRKGMQDMPQADLKWMTAPLVVDYEIGITWGDKCEAEILPDRQIKFKDCDPELYQRMSDKLKRWSKRPEPVYEKEIQELEDGSKIYNTMSSLAKREAQKVTMIESVWQFPN